MPRQVTVESFAGASAAYVKKAVERANTNGNTYLTKSEAAALPADLRDNFEAIRNSSMNGVATAAGFVRDYAKYVQDAAKRADTNGDGVIGSTEIRKLPTDLQDNFAGFSGMKAPAAPPALTSVSLPLSSSNVEKVRAAFVNFVENHLTVRRPSEWEDGEFEYENHEWAELVHEWGGHDEHDALKAEMLDLAKSWTPNSDWQADTTSQGGVYFTGSFKMITLFVDLEKGRPARFMTEID